MYRYICVHIHIYIYMYVCIYVYINIFPHSYTCIYIYILRHTQARNNTEHILTHNKNALTIHAHPARTTTHRIAKNIHKFEMHLDEFQTRTRGFHNDSQGTLHRVYRYKQSSMYSGYQIHLDYTYF